MRERGERRPKPPSTSTVDRHSQSTATKDVPPPAPPTPKAAGEGFRLCQFQQMVAQFFRDESRLVARWPLPFLVLPVLVTVGLSAVLFIHPERLEEKPNENRLAMFLPEGVAAMTHMEILKTLFPPQDVVRESYDVFKSAYAYAIIEDASPQKNVLRDHIIRIASDLNRRIMNLEVSLGWIRANFSQLCHKQGGECLIHPVLVLLNSSDPLSSMEVFLRYPSFKIGDQVIYNSPLFGSVTTDNRSYIAKAEALRLPYLLADAATAPTELRILGYLWQKEFLALMQSLDYPGVNLYFTTAISWAEEIDRNGKLILPYIPALFAVLIVFSVFSCFTNDWVASKPWLGICGILNGCFAVASTMGTLALVEYPFLQMVFIMPFLILSISVDNMFLMLSSWRNTDPRETVENRMATAIGETAVSIMITALTDGLSFSVGSISDFPAVRIFCTYCALAVLLVFFYQMSFFVACMALSGRREAANRHALTFRPAMAKAAARHRGLWYRLCCAGGHGKRPKEAGMEGEFIGRFLSTTYADFISHWAAKVAVLVIYCGYIAASVYGVVQLPLGLDLPMLVPAESYASKEFRATERHFTSYGGYAYAFIDNHDHRLPLHQREVMETLLRLYQGLSKTEYTNGAGQFWLKDFYLATSSPGYPSNPAFIKGLKEFLAKPKNRVFRNDVVFSPDQTIVTGTKMLVQTRFCGFANHTAMAVTLRAIFAESQLPGFVYDPTFMLVDQQDRTLVTTLQNVGIAVGVMLVIAFLFIPKLISSIWIGISILSINMGVIGGLAVWDVHLDIVSMITIVMSIGFSVDYVAHITFHFLVSRPPNRIHQALKYVGLPIVQSALSTVMGVSTLIPAGSYMVKAFVKTVALVVGLGVVHGLVFLPVILSIFVPADTYLETLEIYTNKVSHYLASNIPKYITGIGNKRMRAYHAPSALTDARGTSVETVSLPDSEALPPPPMTRKVSALDNKDIHEPNLRRSTGPRRSVALPPPPPPPMDRSLHSRRSVNVNSLRHATSLAQRLQERGMRESTRQRRGPRHRRPSPSEEDFGDDEPTSSEVELYSEVLDETVGGPLSGRGSWTDSYGPYSSHYTTHPRRGHRRHEGWASSSVESGVATTESSEAPLVGWRGPVAHFRPAPASIHVPGAPLPPDPRRRLHSGSRRERSSSPSFQPRGSHRLYRRRGDSPDHSWVRSERRRRSHRRDDRSRRSGRESEYIPPPPRETREFFFRPAPFSRSISSPDLGPSDSPSPRAETVEIVLRGALGSRTQLQSVVEERGEEERKEEERREEIEGLHKSVESLTSDAFAAFRPEPSRGLLTKMKPAFGNSSVPDFSTFKGRCEGRADAEIGVPRPPLPDYDDRFQPSVRAQMMY